jgi:hypothetical protein
LIVKGEQGQWRSFIAFCMPMTTRSSDAKNIAVGIQMPIWMPPLQCNALYPPPARPTAAAVRNVPGWSYGGRNPPPSINIRIDGVPARDWVANDHNIPWMGNSRTGPGRLNGY